MFNATSTDLFCEVPVQEALKVAPYSLTFDNLVVAKVQALNARGWSDLSNVNTVGERIKTAPTRMSLPRRDNKTDTT